MNTITMASTLQGFAQTFPSYSDRGAPYPDLLKFTERPVDCSDTSPIANCIQSTIASAEKETRKRSAFLLLESIPNYALAFAVLARDAEDGSPDKEHYYQLAYDQMCQRWETKDDGEIQSQVGLDSNGQAVISFEYANLVWARGAKEKGLQIALQCLDADLESPWYCDFFELCISWCVQSNQDGLALAISDRIPYEGPQWFMMRALLEFRAHGDTAAARALVTAACDQDANLLDFLCYEAKEQDLDRLDKFSLQHIALFRACWKITPDGVRWLMSQVLAWESASTVPQEDARILKHLTYEMNMALAAEKRTDFKTARRYWRRALRTAEKMGNMTFRSVAEKMASFYVRCEYAMNDIERAVARSCKQLDTDGNFNLEKTNLYLSLAQTLMKVKKFTAADRLLQRIESNLLTTDAPSAKCLHEQSETWLKLAMCIQKSCSYARAEKAFNKSIDLKKLYLPVQHESIVEAQYRFTGQRL